MSAATPTSKDPADVSKDLGTPQSQELERSPTSTPPEESVSAVNTPVVHVVGFWRRLIASLVDTLILLPFLALGLYLVARISGVSLHRLGTLRVETFLELAIQGGVIFYGLLGLVVTLAMLYTFLFVATTGRTPGLKLLRIRVINIYGERPEWWRAVLRSGGVVIGLLILGLGLLWIGFDRQKRGLHDWLAGTYAVRQRASSGL